MRREIKILALCLLIALAQMACNLPTMIPATGTTPGAPSPTGPAGLLTLTALAGVVTPAVGGTPGAVVTPGAAVTQPAPAVTPGEQGANCTYKAVFVEDVTIPDNTVVPAGQSFIKTWRVRNEGTCTWGPTGHNLHALAFTSGDALNAPAEVPLPGEVPPGGTVDVSVTMQAPDEPGTYTSNWLFRVDGDASGIHWVGIGNEGSEPLYAIIRVQER